MYCSIHEACDANVRTDILAVESKGPLPVGVAMRSVAVRCLFQPSHRVDNKRMECVVEGRGYARKGSESELDTGTNMLFRCHFSGLKEDHERKVQCSPEEVLVGLVRFLDA